ncbi:transporter substrate-binding domain-containing protein [Pseudomonas sp. UL073]|uniref:Transporter substrate-binding domain-containing protein n=1 Tax=Zestomonas insulae TaxID=2809017 RepID=A0ABS2IJK1_9GAMM|nr:ABC transporter substrate-binding protein [Pseudomonas insulae]MBM7062120.1 transporter substrate-binding domain-containing protein [Pseudomonas insulae]
MLRLLAYFLLLLASASGVAREQLTYPLHHDGVNPESYAVDLLRLALSKAGGDFELQPSPQPMSPGRSVYSLERNDGDVQVIWTMTTREREAQLLPVRIPIYKGMIGWRIALVRADEQQLLEQLRSVDDLAKLRIGQRSDWPDTPILRANHLTVETSTGYPGLFRMLVAKRFDLLPLEAVVVEHEQQRMAQEGLGIAIDEHVILHYPSAFYYFTSKQRPELAEAIRRGLDATIADGSFERLFQQHFGATLRALHLKQRRIIELQNPLLPPLPLARKELWYQP